MNLTDIVFTITGSTIILLPLIKIFLDKYIKSKFDSQLEKFKHDLNSITENLKFDFQRKIYDFNLYSSKRHEIYKIMLIAHGKVIGLRGFTSTYEFKELKLESILEIANSLKFPNSTLIELESKWQESEKRCKEYLEKLLRKKEFEGAQTSIFNFNNFYLESKLYMTKEIDSKLELILKNIKLLFHRYDFSEIFGYIPILESGDKDPEEIKKDLSIDIDDLCNKMKLELKKGDYENL